MVRPVTFAPVQVEQALAVMPVATPFTRAVTVYPVIAEPPSDVDAVQATWAEASPAVAETLVGAVGAVGANGVTLLLGAENGPVPTESVAATSNW